MTQPGNSTNLIKYVCVYACVRQVLAKGSGKVTEAEQWVRQDGKSLQKAQKMVGPEHPDAW